jgi:hypothetical protein
MPKAVGLGPLDPTTPSKIHALLLTYTMIAAMAFLAIVSLMRVATTALHHAAVEATMQELHERSSPSVLVNTRADEACEEAGSPNETAQEDHVACEQDNTENVAATDVLPQIAKLAASAEFICVAAAFALSVSPLQLFFNLQELIVNTEGFNNTSADKIIVAVFAVAGVPPFCCWNQILPRKDKRSCNPRSTLVYTIGASTRSREPMLYSVALPYSLPTLHHFPCTTLSPPASGLQSSFCPPCCAWSIGTVPCSMWTSSACSSHFLAS